MRSIGRTTSLVVIGYRCAPVSYRQTIDQSGEVSEHGLRLVVRCLVARLVQPHEAEVAVLANLTKLLSIDDERCIVACSELGRRVVLHCQGYRLSTEPVADIVCFHD